MLIWILILLSKDILVDRSLVKNKCGVLMLLFALMSGVTILLNYKFEFIKNISFYTYTISIMLMSLLNNKADTKDGKLKSIKLIGDVFVFTTFIFTMISVIIFILNINIGVINSSMKSVSYMYYNGRIPGIYFSATMGALLMLVSIMLSNINLYINLYLKRDLKKNLFYVINIIMQILAIYATDSRGSILSLNIYMIMFSLYIYIPYVKKRNINKYIVNISSIILALIVFLIFSKVLPLTRNTIAKLPNIGRMIMEKNSYNRMVSEEIVIGDSIYIKPILEYEKKENEKSILTEKNDENIDNSKLDKNTNNGNDIKNKTENIQSKESVSVSNKGKENKVDMERLAVLNGANGRFDIWKAAIQAYSNKPIFGLSVENTSSIVNQYLPNDMRIIAILSTKTKNCHNSYLQVLVNNGIVGFSILLIMGMIYGVKYIKYFLGNKNRDKYYGILLLMLMTVLILCITGFFEWSIILNISATVPVFWIYINYIYNNVSED